MNICFLSPTAGKDGAEIVLLEAIEALRDRGGQSYILLPSEGVLCDKLGSFRGCAVCLVDGTEMFRKQQGEIRVSKFGNTPIGNGPTCDIPGISSMG